MCQVDECMDSTNVSPEYSTSNNQVTIEDLTAPAGEYITKVEFF